MRRPRLPRLLAGSTIVLVGVSSARFSSAILGFQSPVDPASRFRRVSVVSLLVRAVLLLAGIVTGWLVSRDATNFSVIQMTIAMLLIVLAVFVLAFWPPSWTAKLNRFAKRRPPT